MSNIFLLFFFDTSHRLEITKNKTVDSGIFS